ncbi:MAG: hypothetical protein ABI865_15675, partial [Nitrosospira sp.]
INLKNHPAPMQRGEIAVWHSARQADFAQNTLRTRPPSARMQEPLMTEAWALHKKATIRLPSS